MFRELESQWEQKLTESGFKDIEKRIGEERRFKQSINVHPRDRHRKKQAYFDLLAECFSREIFLDYKIMQDYISGKRRVEILKELHALGIQIHYETIRCIIRRYEYKWGIKNYTLKQMGLKKLPIR